MNDVVLQLNKSGCAPDSKGEFMTLKSLIVMCSKGGIFRDYDAVKDVTQSGFLWSIECNVINEESKDICDKVNTFVNNLLKYAFYSLYLTCVNEYYKKNHHNGKDRK